MSRKNDDLDIKYLGTLYADLSSANKRQEETLRKLEIIARETKAFLESQSEKVNDNRNKLNDHDIRIRDIEKKQYGCNAQLEIGIIKRQLNRLVAFKDMIMSKTNEDSNVLDIHAERLQRAVDDAMIKQMPTKMFIIKMLPWMIIVFVIGIALATIITTKMFYNENIPIPNPSLDIKTNSSSLVNKK